MVRCARAHHLDRKHQCSNLGKEEHLSVSCIVAAFSANRVLRVRNVVY